MKLILEENAKIIKENEVNLKEITHNLEQKEKILEEVITNSVMQTNFYQTITKHLGITFNEQGEISLELK